MTAAPPQSCGLASRAVTVDTVAPRLRGAGLSSERVLPVRDDYLDRVTATATVQEQSWRPSRCGRRRVAWSALCARPRSAGSRPGRCRWVRNGRDASGDVVLLRAVRRPAGRPGPRGNRRAAPACQVTLSTQRLVKQSGSPTVTARSSLTESFFDDCSLVFRHTSGKRKGWVGYDSSATRSSGDAFAAADHQVRLPAAVRRYAASGPVRSAAGVTPSSGTPPAWSCTTGPRTSATPRSGSLPSVGIAHRARVVPAEPLLIRHRLLRWTTSTTGVAWYDVESYTYASPTSCCADRVEVPW